MTKLNPENFHALESLRTARNQEKIAQVKAREEAEELYEARVHAHRQAVAEAIVHARSLPVPTPYVRIREQLGSSHHGVISRYIEGELP